MNDRPKTILLVEDEALIAVNEGKKLRSSGYSVVIANSGEESITLFRKNPDSFDLILMDIDLGRGIDGTEAASEILRAYDVPILFLSSHTEPEIVEKTEQITNYGYVVKSSVFTVLEASIKMAFKLFEAHKALYQKNMEIEAVNERLRVTIESLQVTGEELEAANRNLLEVEREMTIHAKKLSESEARLTKAESVAKFGNWEYHLASNRVMGSNGLKEVLGLPGMEWELSDIEGLSLPEYRPAMKKALQGLIERGEPYDIDFQIKQAGTDAVLDIHSIAEYDRDRGIVFGVIQDVSSQRMAENAARREHLFLRTLIDNLPDLVYFNDAEGRKIIANRADIENIGLADKEEALGKTDLELFPGDIGMRGHRDNLAVVRTGEPIINREEEFQKADGSSRWLLTSKIPLRDSRGDIIGLVGVGRDITDRKITEDKFAQERIFLRTLIDSLPDPIYFKDLTGRKIMSNIASFHGKERSDENDELGKTDLELFPGEIGFRGYLDDQKVFKDGTPILNREEDFIEPDGRVTWLLTSKVALRNAKGEIIGLVGIGHDITERKKLEESLRKTVEQKTTLMKELQHRVKNSLNVVSALLSLEMDALPDEGAKRSFRTALGRIESISAVYERLYLSEDLASVDMRAYIEYLVESIVRTMTIPGKHVRVKSRLCELRLDAAHAVPVGLILNELLTNAIKYAYPPMTEGEIHVVLEASKGRATLKIADDGVGLPETLDPASGDSTGMTIISMLAKQLEGEVIIKSEKGTAVSISFAI